MLVRQTARRFFKPRFNWPRALRNKWLSVALFVLILFTYELFDLWSSPWWTAWLIIAYFLTVLVVDGFFKHASFCKFVCPIGQFNFVASTLSPFEVKVREQDVCVTCHTKDCIRGRREPVSDLVTIRGCELALFQPRKVGNMDCTFCLDCVHACPHDNVGILSRMPGEELLDRSPAVGHRLFFAPQRPCRAGNCVYFWSAAERFWHGQSGLCGGELAGKSVAREPRSSGARHHLHVLSDSRTCSSAGTGRLVRAPVVRQPACPAAAGGQIHVTAWSRWASACGWRTTVFTFLTGLYTVIPVTQSALANLGWPILGEPRWTLTGLPANVVQVIEIGFLLLGFAGSLVVTHGLAEEDSPARPLRAFLPWAAVCLFSGWHRCG